MTAVAVLGAGSWGTTLATILARDGSRDVVLWARESEQARTLAAERENRRYLAGIRIPDRVVITADLREAVAGADDLVVATPSIGVGALREQVAPHLRPQHHILSATKGLAEDGRRMSELWGEVVGAFIRPCDPAAPPTVAELRSHLRASLSPQKTPTMWYAVDGYPLTGSGKVQKFAIREAWEKGEHAGHELDG